MQKSVYLPGNPLNIPIVGLSRRTQRRLRLEALGRANVVKTANYAGSITTADATRGPSPAIWAKAPLAAVMEDPSLGMYFFDDFIMTGNMGPNTAAITGSMGQWTCYADIGAAAIQADGQLEGGVIVLGSDGDNEGVTLSSTASSYRITTTSTLALNQPLWFEARLARSVVTATLIDCFVGLCDHTTSSGLAVGGIPITTTIDTLSTTPNFIGFFSKGSVANEWSFAYNLAGGTVVLPTNLTTLMNSVIGAVLTANQQVKLGFVFDPTAGNPAALITLASTGQTVGVLARPLIKIYVNGLPAAAFLTSTNVQGTAFPTGFMGPTIAVMNDAGSSPGTIKVDWIRVLQLANS
jgi:hypothetical protein